MKDEYVGLLGRGIGTWNAWRAEHDEVPDLSSANLRALDLSGFDLSLVDLRRADAVHRGARRQEPPLHAAQASDPKQRLRGGGRYADRLVLVR